ncbi:ROK family protein [Thiohalorhabdus sp.]|uniref:ROK family protein n=1 Tax=Thiohalorhabdus sp. TaxID=3094134 RepID=UPI002FC3C4CD
MSALRLGVDLGGTKIEIAALEPKGGEVLRRRVESPRGDYAATLETVAGLVEATEAELGTSGCSLGVAMPGAISPATGLVKNANSTWLIGRPLDRDLGRRLDRPVRVANDANCFALSESVDGAGAGMSPVFGVIVGTGTGAGIVVDGRVLTGANAIAGEWGHNPLPWPTGDEAPGPECYCGRRGCIETFLAGPGMAADHRRATGDELAPEAIAVRAGEGDPQCRATLDRYVHRMARALAHIINLLDPEVIVLGGGMGNIADLYRQVPLRWDAFVFSDRVATRLLAPAHGDSSGVRGAAWLWPAESP